MTKGEEGAAPQREGPECCLQAVRAAAEQRKSGWHELQQIREKPKEAKTGDDNKKQQGGKDSGGGTQEVMQKTRCQTKTVVKLKAKNGPKRRVRVNRAPTQFYPWMCKWKHPHALENGKRTTTDEGVGPEEDTLESLQEFILQSLSEQHSNHETMRLEMRHVKLKKQTFIN